METYDPSIENDTGLEIIKPNSLFIQTHHSIAHCLSCILGRREHNKTIHPNFEAMDCSIAIVNFNKVALTWLKLYDTSVNVFQCHSQHIRLNVIIECIEKSEFVQLMSFQYIDSFYNIGFHTGYSLTNEQFMNMDQI